MHSNSRCLLAWFALSLLQLVSLPSEVEAQRITYTTRDVGTSLNVPWEMRWGFDDKIWFTERAGRFNRIDPDTKERRILLREPDCYQLSEAGMLGFDFDPDFPAQPYVYIIFTNEDSTYYPDSTVLREKLYRYRWDKDLDSLVDRVTLFDRIDAYYQHNGSRVVIGADRKIYVSTGETWFQPWLAQQDSSANGKILRLNLDGSIPADNPWPGSPVWSKGHRNPQGLAFGPNGILYETEHGTGIDDELNIIEKGGNYGWPNVEGFCDLPQEVEFCKANNVREPLYSWSPTVALSGAEYYAHSAIPEWQNGLLIATLKDTSLMQITLDPTGRQVLHVEYYPILLTSTGLPAKRLRDVCFSPTGRIFISTSNIWSPQWTPDRIFEITRTGVVPLTPRPKTPLWNSHEKTQSIKFVWEDIKMADRYELQISDTSDFSTILQSTFVSERQVTLPVLRDGDLYWRVRSLKDTLIGEWSWIMYFNHESLGVEEQPTTSSRVKATVVRVADGRLSIQLHGERQSPDISCAVYDMLGREVEGVSGRSANSNFLIDIRHLAEGAYVLRIESGDLRTSLRFIR